VDWGSFLTGVAVTVVGGLILAALFGGPRWYVRRRERQAKEAEAEFIRRTPIRVGGHIVATELRWNAGVLKRCEEGGDVPAELRAVRLDEWRDRESEMAGLQDEAPDLWKELSGTYADLDHMRLAWHPRLDRVTSRASPAASMRQRKGGRRLVGAGRRADARTLPTT
jgi:hypothetical protein